jgi:hypothetical protein
MTQEMTTKFIRLVTGEDIVANCLIDNETQYVDVESPMKVIISRFNNSRKSILIMMPWLPLEVIDDEYATLKFEDILTMVDPKEAFIEYYNNTVDKYRKLVESNEQDEMFTNELEDDFFEDEITDEEVAEHDELALEEALQSINSTSTKKVLH